MEDSGQSSGCPARCVWTQGAMPVVSLERLCPAFQGVLLVPLPTAAWTTSLLLVGHPPCVPTDPLPPWTCLSCPRPHISICCVPSVGAQTSLCPGQGCWGHSVCECRAYIWTWAAMEENMEMRGEEGGRGLCLWRW